MPLVKLLSNGNYHVMLTSAGGGYSCWKGLAITRWHEDAVLDNWGSFCYLRDGNTGAVWSSTFQPTTQRPDSYRTSFDTAAASFLRQDQGIETHTEIAVSVDDDVELRRLRITNFSQRSRTLSATSFTEIVLAAAATDSAHPSFSKLFVETTIDPSLHAILATRRPSSHDEASCWFFHLVRVSNLEGAEVSYETDRMRFIGRGRCTVNPQALQSDAALSGSAGPVLDAVAAIRIPFTLGAGASLTIDWLTGVATSRDDCVALARKYQNAREAQRILEQAAQYRLTALQRLQASDSGALLYERLAASIIYADAAWRADGGVIQQNRRGQPGLWGFAISGDLPVVLLKLSLLPASSMQFNLLHQMVQAHAYWSAFGIKSELVVLVASADEQNTTLVESIKQLIASGQAAECLDKPGGIFVLDSAKLDDGHQILLQSVSRLLVSDTAGTLDQQIEQRNGPATVKLTASASGGAPELTAMVGTSGESVLNPEPEGRPPPGDRRACNGCVCCSEYAL